MSVTLHTTHGALKLELFVDSVPQTCTNFLALCASSYYDAVPIHRIIPSFLLQTGDGVLRTGKHAGRSIWGSTFEDEIKAALRHSGRGVVAMANKGANTNASQFYVTFKEQKHLDGVNTVFGRVVDGWETLDRLEKVETDKKGRPKEKVVVERVTIHANPIADMDSGD